MEQPGKELSPLAHLLVIDLRDEVFNAPYVDCALGASYHKKLAGGAGDRIGNR